MSNTLLTTSQITNEALMVLTNMLNFTKKVNRQYDDRFAQSGAKIGDTINIRKPIKLRFSTGQNIDVQAATEQYTPLTLDTQYQRAMAFSSKDRTLSIDMFSERFIKPAMISMANQIDFDGFSKALNYTYNQVGTVGSTYTDRDTLNKLVTGAGVTLSRFMAPQDRALVASTQFMADAATYNNNLFNPQSAIGAQYEDAKVIRALGFDWSESQNAPVHTNGTYSGTPAVVGAGQSGSTLNTNGWGAGSTLNVGDVFTVAGVFTVNGQTKQNTGVLQKFVVTAKNAPATTHALSISPAIVGPENAQLQNVSALPAGGALITVEGASGATYQTSMAFHKDAYVFGCADLDVPSRGTESAGRAKDDQLGLSIRFVEQYDIRSDQWVTRFDLLGGWAPLYAELGTRLVTL